MKFCIGVGNFPLFHWLTLSSLKQSRTTVPAGDDKCYHRWVVARFRRSVLRSHLADTRLAIFSLARPCTATRDFDRVASPVYISNSAINSVSSSDQDGDSSCTFSINSVILYATIIQYQNLYVSVCRKTQTRSSSAIRRESAHITWLYCTVQMAFQYETV